MHILLTCENCLDSCDFLDSFCTLCLEVRQSVSKLENPVSNSDNPVSYSDKLSNASLAQSLILHTV